MERLRQHIHRRRRSSTPSRAPPQGSQSPSLSSDRRKKSNSVLRRLYVTSDTADFDADILRRFEAEGFSVEYIPFQGSSGDFERDRKDLDNLIHEREDDLEPGERYAIVGTYIRPRRYDQIANRTTTPSIQQTSLPSPYIPPPPNNSHQPFPSPLCPSNLLPPDLRNRYP